MKRNPFIERNSYDASVIVSIYEQSQSLELSLYSLLNQAFNGTYEIVICDDGSHQDTFVKFECKFNQAQVPVRYIWQQNKGMRLGESTNNGILLAKGKIIILINGDMLPDRNFIQNHISAHNKPRSIVAGRRMYRDFLELQEMLSQKDKNRLLEYIFANQPKDESFSVRQDREHQLRLSWINSNHPWRACVSCNLSIERNPEVVFDEHFTGWGADDWELAYRLIKTHGYTPFYEQTAQAYQLEIPSETENIFRNGKPKTILQFIRNVFYFHEKHPEIDKEVLFFNLPKLELNIQTNQWEVRLKPLDEGEFSLEEVIKTTKQWLENHPLEE